MSNKNISFELELENELRDIKKDLKEIKKSINELSNVKDDINEIKKYIFSFKGNSNNTGSLTSIKLEEENNQNKRKLETNSNSDSSFISQVNTDKELNNISKKIKVSRSEYDQRIEYYIKALKYDIFPIKNISNSTNIVIEKKLFNNYVSRNSDFDIKFFDYINKIIELNLKILYLMIEQRDLDQVLDAAFEKDFCSTN
eukprot:jgi/Orpsp1_1/1192027/evm.model.d7180000090045.1